jgi:hypothetical protein
MLRVSGKVRQASGSSDWVEETGSASGNVDLDCSYGPLNMILA